jgi:hypothetical protein
VEIYVTYIYPVKARDIIIITMAEMKYMRKTAEYIWTEYKTNRLQRN